MDNDNGSMYTDKCPICPPDKKEAWGPKVPPAACVCPTMIYIPPGQHIHVDCPVHGKQIMYGSNIVW